MNDLLAFLVPALGNAVLHFLWQGALIGVLAWLALTALYQARPQVRYAVACLALLACVLVPAWSVLQAMFGASGSNVQSASAVGAAAGNALQGNGLFGFERFGGASQALLPWIVAAWAAGASALSLRMACGLLWVHRLRARSASADTRTWQDSIDRLARGIGIRRNVLVRIIADGDSPLSIGWLKPVVLLPAAIAARMPAPLLEALLAHELAHIRRHDYLINLLQGVVEALLFYHPVVWWLSHRIRIEREQVADRIAADAIGEPRRLALALSALDRLAIARAPLPLAGFAQAAHGGHLMSRIHTLLRPEHRIVGGALLLPAIGIVALGIAFQAYAQLGSGAHASHASTAAGVLLPAPPTPPAPPAAPSVPLPPAPPAAPPPPVQRSLHYGNSHDGYALVRKGQDGFAMSGALDDVGEIKAIKHRIDGDFLWFRRDGQAWVLRDATLLARAEQAWAGTRMHEQKMQALHTRMEPHQRTAEALSARIERMQPQFEQSPEMQAAERAMEALAGQQEALAAQQEALAAKMERADEGRRRQLDQAMQTLAARHQPLAAQMQRHSEILQAQHQRMQSGHARMEAISREMEAASKPMEAIGREMEVLGVQLEQQATIADRQVRKLIDDAVQRGLAQPAPTLR